MIKFITFMLYSLPLALAWLYLGVAVLVVLIQIMRIKRKAKQTVGLWMFSSLHCVYILTFAITRIFFFEVWETAFSVLGFVAIFLSACWSRYEDRRNGRRWWEW